MSTITERIQAHQQAGNVPAALQQARAAAERAAMYLAMYQDGSTNPQSAHAEYAARVDLLYDQTGELTELGSALQLCVEFVSTMDTNHPWVQQL
jgi:hypothetical protein